jgi:hypothetical protein
VKDEIIIKNLYISTIHLDAAICNTNSFANPVHVSRRNPLVHVQFSYISE